MSQSTFDKWVTIKNKSPAKNFFYLDWSSSNKQAIWLSSMPTKVNFSSVIRWKEAKTQITICGYIDEKPYDIPSSSSKYMSVAKSHLQKCVRRQLVDKSVSTAWLLITQDVNEFLRRLPIIFLEDVILDQSFINVMWFVSAVSKGYQLTQSQIEWLLGVVSALANNQQYDFIHDSHHKVIFDFKKKLGEIDKNLTNDRQKDILYAILLRYSYGGMPGDMNMMLFYVNTWLERFQKKNNLPCMNIKIIAVNQVSPLVACDWEASAIDFHCCPVILDYICRFYPQYNKDQIKSAIWHGRSKINTRVDQATDDSVNSIWCKIKKMVGQYQRSYISTNFADE